MPLDDLDRRYLERAVALARKGRFAVEPNPQVGCVLVRDGRIVGEGWHAAFGGPHAERAAIARVEGSAGGATAYVSLQPCSRHGKTPACTDALRQAGVARVVFAAADPNEAEGALAGLRVAGIRVEGPHPEVVADEPLRAFLAARGRSRPWVVLKWAMSADGRIALGPGRGGAISGERARLFVHDLRAHVDAVLVGVSTVVADDPRLTCRLEGGPPDGRAQPLRVVLDPSLRTSDDARLFEDLPAAPLLFVAADPPGTGASARVPRLLERGAGVLHVPGRPGAEGALDLARLLEELRGRGVARLLVEGGAKTHGAFLRAGLADQVTVLVAPRLLGGSGAPSAVEGSGFDDLATAPRLLLSTWRRLGEDLLLQAYVGDGPDRVSERSGARS